MVKQSFSLVASVVAFLSLMVSPPTATATATNTITNDSKEDPVIYTAVHCIDNWQDLQQAIHAIPRGDAIQENTPTITLCPTTINLPEAIQIEERSVRIQCAATDTRTTIPIATARSSDEKCILKGTTEARLLEITGTPKNQFSKIRGNPASRQTVSLSNLQLIAGENVNHQDTEGGGALYARGVNLVVEDCFFEGNVSMQQGGAISVQDAGRHILFLVTRTQLQDNISVQDDCHSIYFYQEHPASAIEINTEVDYIRKGRQLEHWDDPAKATQALQEFVPGAGATLCF